MRPICLIAILFAFFATITFATEPNYDVRWYAKNPKAKTFTISTAEELAGLAHITRGTWNGESEEDNFKGKTIILAKNIDLSQYDNWVPITTFSGNFDGKGHIISNLTINLPDKDYQGLFGRVRSGKVENLGLENVNIRGKRSVGGIAGEILVGSNIFNSYSTGMVSGKALVGGIAGDIFTGSVTDSYSTAAVSCDVSCGSVAGSVNWGGKVDNSYSTGAISGRLFVGGIAGEVAIHGSVNDSYSTSAVSGDEIVGGIAGGTDISSSVNNCSENSKVKGNKNVGSVTGLKAKKDQ